MLKLRKLISYSLAVLWPMRVMSIKEAKQKPYFDLPNHVITGSNNIKVNQSQVPSRNINTYQLSKLLNIDSSLLFHKLHQLGFCVMDEFQILDTSQIASLANDLGVDVKFVDSKIVDLKERTPVVSIMGHVNHGKTTLLDAFRNSHKYEEEFGHITQSLEAFTINLFKQD